jgi:anti-anti-sigma factor
MTQETSIKTEIQNGVVIVSFAQPSIGALNGIGEISKAINDYVDQNKPQKLIVDFEGVKFFSSQALGMLIELWRKLEKYQGKMVISGINPQLYRVFKITNLNKIFQFFDDSQSAVKSFGEN